MRCAAACRGYIQFYTAMRRMTAALSNPDEPPALPEEQVGGREWWRRLVLVAEPGAGAGGGWRVLF